MLAKEGFQVQPCWKLKTKNILIYKKHALESWFFYMPKSLTLLSFILEIALIKARNDQNQKDFSSCNFTPLAISFFDKTYFEKKINILTL